MQQQRKCCIITLAGEMVVIVLSLASVSLLSLYPYSYIYDYMIYLYVYISLLKNLRDGILIKPLEQLAAS
jgi:hypothetical protein